MHRFISKEYAHRYQHHNCQPHPGRRRNNTFLYKFFAKHIEEVKNQEEYDGHDERHTNTAFPDNRAKRRPDKEQYQAGEGK